MLVVEKMRIVSFIGSMQTESVVDYEKATCSHFHWMSKDSEEWNTYFRGRTEAK